MASSNRREASLGGLRAVDYPGPMSDPSGVRSLVEGFTAAWAKPSADGLAAMCTEDVRLEQPVTPIVVGREATRREFARVLRWLPDLHGVVDEWGVSDGSVMIAFRLRCTLGGKPFEIRVIDRIVERGGLVAERKAYYDSLSFMIETLRRPRAWLGYLRYRGYLPGG
jgi:ketosteroid isomerase-like protein